ncbi:MAG: hypothetical protein QME41_03170 [Actinomycetota bacterium]|nr:hypothetical protein [Actinomycetota bacterium]
MVHRDSGLMALSYEGMPVPEKTELYSPDENIFVPAEGLGVISRAAESNFAKEK